MVIDFFFFAAIQARNANALIKAVVKNPRKLQDKELIALASSNWVIMLPWPRILSIPNFHVFLCIT